MNVKEELICRLCLQVAENDYQIIEEITKKMLQVLLLKVNLDISKDPIVCKDCSEVLIKCFDFKSAYADNIEKLIFTYAINKNTATYKSNDINKEGSILETVGDNLICRFCSHRSNGSNFIFLKTLKNDATFAEMLQTLMPDTVKSFGNVSRDFDVIENPIICTSCIEDSERYVKFAKNCLDVEEKITKYCRNEGTSLYAEVKLSEVLRFSRKNILEFDYPRMCAIKQENTGEARFEINDMNLIKTEDNLDIKDEEFKYDTSDTSIYRLNIACGSKTEIGKAQQALTNCVEHDVESNGISLEEEQASRLKYKSEISAMYDMKSTNATGEPIFKCTMCTYQSKLKGGLKNHMVIHRAVTEVTMYKCSMCDYETRRKGNLTSHMLVHRDVTEAEMYKCPTCTYKTKHKTYLKCHTSIHKDAATYKCSMCVYETNQKRNLKSHVLVHKNVTEVDMVKCSMCSFRTKKTSYLKRHMLIHENKTYKCSMCTYETKEKRELKTHTLIHKPDTAETHKCPTCTYRTKRKANLRIHMVIHKDIGEVATFKCSSCTYETKRKGDLKSHTLIHSAVSEVVMYKCLACPYETKLKCNLKNHTIVHKNVAEVEIYKCSMCTFETKRKKSLKNHVLVHKGIVEMETKF